MPIRFTPQSSTSDITAGIQQAQEVQGSGRQGLIQQDPNIASPSNVTHSRSAGRSNLGQQILGLFGTIARPAMGAVMGVMLLSALAPTTANAQVRTEVAHAATVQRETFNQAKFTEYPLFKMFWDTASTQAEGLTNQGEFELTRVGVEKLRAFALSHDLDGREVVSTEVSPSETAFIKHLLEHPHYGAFIEQDARPELQRAFGLPVEVAHPTVGERPEKVGDISIPRGVSLSTAYDLQGPLISNLPKMFESEYASRRAFFEDASASPEEKSKRVLGLFADYAAAIRFHGTIDYTESSLEGLQAKLQATPFWSVLGSKDYNGAGWSVVESLALGLDPNKFQIDFPNSGVTIPVDYLSMDAGVAESMKPVDLYRIAAGLDARAEAYERKSVLGFIVGDESGHKKVGYFNEAKPFASSGVNWGLLLFPNDQEIAKLKPKEGFEFPIDAIDAFGIAFNNSASFGDRLKVFDANKRELQVVRQIHPADGDKPATWSAKFVRADGSEVPPADVIGLIFNSSGKVKGDGRAAASLDMGFWGFCNVNTAQSVYKASYGIPQLDANVVRVRAPNGSIIEFPKAIAQKLLDADIEGLISKQAYAGFRFGRDPQTIRLLDGTSIIGTMESYSHVAGRRTTRDFADVITVYATAETPFPSSVGITIADGTVKRVRASDIVAVREAPDGKVEIESKASYGANDKTVGVLSVPVSFEGAPLEDGVRVFHPSAAHPIIGEVSIKLPDGTTKLVPANQVSSVSGETESDIRPSDFVAMVSRMNGVFATDASKGPSISNGARNVKSIETIVERGAHRPEWAKSLSNGIYGPLVREDGDKMLYRRGTFGNSDYTSTAFSMWHQLDAGGRVINEGWISGEPDFLWGSVDPLNWKATSIWNPHFPAELRISLLVNGVTDTNKLASLAKQLNLPENWRDYLTPAR